MPSTQASLSTEKGNDVGPVNKQPPPALGMSTDPNGPEQRAMRLRGGCFVRHSSAVPMPIINTFSRNANAIPVDAAICNAAFEDSMRRRAPMQPAMRHRCVYDSELIPQFQLLIRILGCHPFVEC